MPVQYVPLTTWDKPGIDELQLQGDEKVYFLDYIGPRGFARSVANYSKEVIVLDHHKTAVEELAGAVPLPPNMKVHLDMNKSGATIAKEYFGIDVDPEIDKCFKIIEDGDLWRWQIPGAKAFYAGLHARNIEFNAVKNPHVFEQLLSLQPQDLIKEGGPILEEEQGMLRQQLENSFTVSLGGPGKPWGTALAVRTNDERVIQKRTSGPIHTAALVQEVRPGETTLKVSLRSCDGFDTTPITTAFGGGGHAAAGSCMMAEGQFQAWRCATQGA